MNIQRDIQSLMESGLNFSIELNGGALQLWVGDYLQHGAPTATVASFEQAVEWLRGHVQRVGDTHGAAGASN